MMQKRNLYSLLLISFIAVFAVSSAFANTVTFESRTGLQRCVTTSANVTASVTADSVSAIEIVVEINGDITLGAPIFTFDPSFTALASRVVDDTSGVDGTLPDTIRIAAMVLHQGEGALAKGDNILIGRLNFRTNDLCQGAGTFNGVDSFAYPIPALVKTQFVDAATSAILPVVVTNGSVAFQNAAPTLAPIANPAPVYIGSPIAVTPVGADADAGGGCETLTYSLVTAPAGMTINAGTGAIAWLPTAAGVGCNPVTVKVTDKCGAFAQQSFSVSVLNHQPAITCPPNASIALGDSVFGAFVGSDVDPGQTLLYTLKSFTGPGSFTVLGNGTYKWKTVNSDMSYLGNWTATIIVTDGAKLDNCNLVNADTCSFNISVFWGGVKIAKVHNAHLGQHTIDTVLALTNYPIGGFDLLIAYDASSLNLTGVKEGNFLTDCGWEYFEYRFGANGNCSGSGCPTGLVRIVGMAETNNGAHHPTCFSNYPGPFKALAYLDFMVTNNNNMDCQYLPVQFFWLDCGDNGLSNVRGDSLLISRNVYAYDLPLNIADQSASFPTFYGANASCNTQYKLSTWRIVDFYNGGVDIICNDSIDARGDINMNGLAYEVADAVMFTNYFIYGTSAFGQYVEGASVASDVNADGLKLTVADLVYLIRVVLGDAMPYAKPGDIKAVAANITHEGGVLSVDGGIALGGAAVVVSGNVTPTLLANNMKMAYNFDGTNTRIVVYPDVTGKGMESFSGSFLQVPGTVVSVELATALGQPVTAKLLPKNYALDQNYPNPFNPTTNISFALPSAGAYTLTVYNVNGQAVKTFTGTAPAGYVNVTWNASDVSSGVYFYKLTAGSFTATKKMMLVK